MKWRNLSFPVLALCALWSGCRQTTVTAEKPQSPPAKVANSARKETELATITLTEEAARRLGIEIATAQEKPGGRSSTWAGEVMVPPGQALVVSAPVAGAVVFTDPGFPPVGSSLKRDQVLLHLTPLVAAERDVRVSVQAEVAAAQTRVEAARARSERAERLLKDQVGSVKAKELAQEELALAETALTAARAKLERLNRTPLAADVKVAIAVPQDGLFKKVHVAAGQMVAAGSPLFEVERLDTVWIRVPVYVGELAGLAAGGKAAVRPLNADSSAPARPAAPVAAPPSADAAAATVDLYFAVANADLWLRPGQKVSVTLPLRGEARSLSIPSSAVLYDIHGGSWVYEEIAPRKFARRRVEVARMTAGLALVARGLQPGAKVVSTGAAELFGAEFGMGK
jgi:RND family efflux transporter MFP subunit